MNGPIKRMVDRFLAWQFPSDFNPDGGISFNSSHSIPVGTNLLTATQAEQMIQHITEPDHPNHPRIPLLDNGYITLIQTWGSDEQIIEAARMSTNKGFNGWGTPDAPGDERLLAYLYNNKHATPFEMAGMTIEVKAPIFVFREWHRHRTQSYNEMSARYVPLPDENYVPTINRLLANQSTTNKQAQSLNNTTDQLSFKDAEKWLEDLQSIYTYAESVYQRGLKLGVPKELARLPVPVARYSRMRASANLRNWLGFLTLRQSTAAQWEIREYANAVGTLIEQNFPRTWELYAKSNFK